MLSIFHWGRIQQMYENEELEETVRNSHLRWSFFQRVKIFTQDTCSVGT